MEDRQEIQNLYIRVKANLDDNERHLSKAQGKHYELERKNLLQAVLNIISKLQPKSLIYLDFREFFIAKTSKSVDELRMSHIEETIKEIKNELLPDNCLKHKNRKIIIDNNQELRSKANTQRIVSVIRHFYSTSEDNIKECYNHPMDVPDIGQESSRISTFVEYAHHHSMVASHLAEHNFGLPYTKGPIPLWKCIRFFFFQTNNKDKNTTNTNVNLEATSAICCSALLDCFLGFILAWATLKFSNGIRYWLFFLWNHFYYHKLRDATGWLESYPLGFKLNIELTACFGRQIRSLMDFQNDIVTSLASSYGSAIQVSLALAAGIFGANFFFCVLFDMVSTATVHIHLILDILRRLFRLQLGTLSSLWLLFRGKKKNILRKRNDTMDYDAMQLLFGMFLFCIVVFLFTTFFVYYVFFSVVEALTFILMSMNFIFIACVKEAPVYKLCRRTVTPNALCREIYFDTLKELQMESNKLAAYAELILIHESPIEILRDAYKKSAAVLLAAWKFLFAQTFTCRRVTAHRILVEGKR